MGKYEVRNEHITPVKSDMYATGDSVNKINAQFKTLHII